MDLGVPSSAGLSWRRRPLEPTPGTAGCGETVETGQGKGSVPSAEEEPEAQRVWAPPPREWSQHRLAHSVPCDPRDHHRGPLAAAWGSGDRLEHLLSLGTFASACVFSIGEWRGVGWGSRITDEVHVREEV